MAIDNLLVRTETDPEVGVLTTDNGAAPAPDPQLLAAKEVGNIWKYDGKEYARLVVNSTGTVSIPVKRSGVIVGYLGADFAWDGDRVFLEHVDLDIRHEKNTRQQETRKKMANLTRQNQILFAGTLQRGFWTPVEDGVHGETVSRTRDEMLKIVPEMQSNLIDAWLSAFHVENVTKASSDFESLFSEPDSIDLLVRIGNYDDPAHVLLVKFNAPPPDARRDFEDASMIAGDTQRGDTVVTHYFINNEAKLKFARKWLREIQGAVLAKTGELDLDTKDFREIDNEVAVGEFKRQFNPHWLMALANPLMDAFDIGGK